MAYYCVVCLLLATVSAKHLRANSLLGQKSLSMDDLHKLEAKRAERENQRRNPLLSHMGGTKNNHYTYNALEDSPTMTPTSYGQSVNVMLNSMYGTRTAAPSTFPTSFPTGTPYPTPFPTPATNAPTVFTTRWSCGIKVVGTDFTANGAINQHEIQKHKKMCLKHAESERACKKQKTCQWIHFVITARPTQAPSKAPTLKPTGTTAIPTLSPTSTPTATAAPTESPTAAPTTLPTSLMAFLYGRDVPTKQPTQVPTNSKVHIIKRYLQERREVLTSTPRFEEIAVGIYRSFYTDPVPSQGVAGLPFGWQRQLPSYTATEAANYVSGISEHLATLRFEEARQLWFLSHDKNFLNKSRAQLIADSKAVLRRNHHFRHLWQSSSSKKLVVQSNENSPRVSVLAENLNLNAIAAMAAGTVFTSYPVANLPLE
jgi:hypothetical protein